MVSQRRAELVVILLGILSGIVAFSGCIIPGDCEQDTIPEWHFVSGLYESDDVSGDSDGLPHLDGAETKTLELDTEAGEVVVRYFDSQQRRVEETWTITEVEPFDTYTQ